MELKSYLKENGINASQEACDALERHLAFVIEANERVQLTTIKDLEEGKRLHILDSLTCLSEVNKSLEGPLLDMGTGGGFPGIPLAIVTGRKVSLLDSIKKKLAQLEELLSSDEAYSNISLKPVRAEELAGIEAEKYAVITARALSSLPSVIELASPLLTLGGSLIALKGNLSDEELSRGDIAAALVGLKRVSLRRFELPDTHDKRTIVVYKKVKKSKRKLPRRVGLAQKQPLA